MGGVVRRRCSRRRGRGRRSRRRCIVSVCGAQRYRHPCVVPRMNVLHSFVGHAGDARFAATAPKAPCGAAAVPATSRTGTRRGGCPTAGAKGRQSIRMTHPAPLSFHGAVFVGPLCTPLARGRGRQRSSSTAAAPVSLVWQGKARATHRQGEGDRHTAGWGADARPCLCHVSLVATLPRCSSSRLAASFRLCSWPARGGASKPRTPEGQAQTSSHVSSSRVGRRETLVRTWLLR
jgi:hypothetical protein